MNAPATKGAFADRLPKATTFRAWRVGEANALPLDIGEPTDLAEAVFAATSHFLAHKDTLIVHEHDAARRKGTLHTFAIRKKAATWVRNPVSGLSERMEPLFADKLFAVPVDAFEPTRGFDAFRDNASGRDLSLVTVR